MNQRDNNRVLPHNVEAERSVLGAMLLNPDAIEAGIEALGDRPQQLFYVEAHQYLYRAVLALVKAGAPVDSVSLMEQLSRERKLEAAGGMSYIAGLASSVPTSANIEHYAKIVREAATLRRVIATCSRISSACYSGQESVEDILANAQGVFDGLEKSNVKGKTFHVADVVETVVDRVDRFLKGEQTSGIPTPWGWLNELTGGLSYGEISFLLARPNVGKTAMMLNIALHAAAVGVPVLVLSLEMCKEKLVERLLNIDGGVDFKRIEKRWQAESEVKKLTESAIRVGRMNVWISDEPTTTAADVRAAARRFASSQGAGLVLLDYAQKVATPGMDKLNVELAVAITALTKIPKETGHHLFVLGQLSREADALATGYEKWGKGAGTSQIEKDADMGFVLHAPKAKQKKSIAALYGCDVSEIENVFHLTLAKNRNGPTGDNYLRFIKDRQRFHEVVITPPGAESATGSEDPNEEIDEADTPF